MNPHDPIPVGDRGPRALPVGPAVDALSYTLGEGSPAERAAFRDALQSDLGLAVEIAELRDLFERCREIGTGIEPSGRVERALRRAVSRRVELRGLRRVSGRERLQFALRVAAVALISLAVGVGLRAALPRAGQLREGLRGWERIFVGPEVALVGEAVGQSAGGQSTGGQSTGGQSTDGQSASGVLRRRAEARPADPELVELLAAAALPVLEPGFIAEAERLAARPLPDEFRALLSAENRLALLRAEAELRFSPELRAAQRAATGAPDLDDRIRTLAAEVAQRVAVALRDRSDPRAHTAAIAIAMRGLVAAGSSAEVGPHQAQVRACRARLLAELEELGAAPPPADGTPVSGATALRTAVLAALTELAVLGDTEVIPRIGAAVDDLARGVLRAAGGAQARRPDLLSWSTPNEALADAGRLFWIAPAFGTHAGLAFRARLMVAAHLQERLEAGAGAEQPARVAALLYGFGDLIDRADADRRLALWRPRMLASDLVAMHHLSWSKYPVRPGWATFQRELRGIAAIPTPDGLRDAAALLLSLCTNVAAPGAGTSTGALIASPRAL
jgi:hypothetical protein